VDRISRHKSGGMTRRGVWLALTLWFLSSSATEAVSQVRPGAAQSAGVDAQIDRRVRMTEAGLAPLRCGLTCRESGRADSSQGEAALLAEAAHFEAVFQEPRLTVAQVIQELRSDRREINEFTDHVATTLDWNKWEEIRTSGPLFYDIREVFSWTYFKACPQPRNSGFLRKSTDEDWALSLKTLEMRVEATGVVPAQQVNIVREAMQEWRAAKARFIEVARRLGQIKAELQDLYYRPPYGLQSWATPAARRLFQEADQLAKEIYVCQLLDLTIREQERISGRITDMNALFGPPR
jgi:hypothetical protein